MLNVDRYGVVLDVAGRWTAAAPMNHPRFSHRLLLLHDGRVLAHGGLFADNTKGRERDGYPGMRWGEDVPVSQSEVWDPESGLWRDVPPAMAQELALGAIVQTSRKVPFPFPHTQEMEDRDRRTVVRESGSLVPLDDGGVLIAGGLTNHHYADSSEPSEDLPEEALLHRADGRFQLAGTIAAPRAFTAGVRLADGRVMLSGGRTITMFERQTFALVEIWERL